MALTFGKDLIKGAAQHEFDGAARRRAGCEAMASTAHDGAPGTQGPYMGALRRRRGHEEIAALFVAGRAAKSIGLRLLHGYTESRNQRQGKTKKTTHTGFGSSMLFGTVAGSLADTLGRKRGALAYVVVYAASCVTKHWRSYEVLMFGRVLGGIATSLLFSVFDSWLVAEHASRGFEPAWLSTTFANAQAGTASSRSCRVS